MGFVRNGSNRVIRGGSWNNNAQNCRSANRNNNDPDNRNNNLGYRVLKLNNNGLDDQRVIDQDEFLFAFLRLNHFENVILVAAANV